MTRFTRGLLWLGIAAPIYREGLVFLLGLITADYSASRDFISELGALDAPYRELMNIYGAVLSGTLIAASAIGLYRVLSGRSLGRTSAVLVALYGIGLVGAGMTPCDPGCIAVEPSMRMTIHMLSGLVGMGAAVFAALAFGIGGLRDGASGVLNTLALVLGTLGVLLFIVFSVAVIVRAPELAGMYGALQRTMVGAADLWLISVCWSYSRTNTQSARRQL